MRLHSTVTLSRVPGRRSVLLAPVAAVFVVAAAAAPAAAQLRDERLVQFVRPSSFAGVPPAGKALELKVRSGARVRVYLSGRDVTRALRLRGGRRLRGTIPFRFARSFPRRLEAVARNGRRVDADLITLVAVRPRRGFASVRLRSTGTPHDPVLLTISTRRHRVNLEVRLNGRRLENRLTSNRLGARRLMLTRREGLRFGRNVVTVLAHDGRGHGHSERRTFVVRRTGPLAAVGAPRSVRMRSRVTLDARRSQASRAGRRLAYRWRLVRRPPGSAARLRATTSARPRLVPDRPGRYLVRLALRERSRGARAAASTSSTLDTTVVATPPIPPYGFRLTTDPTNAAAGAVYGTFGGNRTYPLGPPGSTLVLLIDRTTGLPTSSTTIPPLPEPPPGETGVRDLETLIRTLIGVRDPNTLVTLVAPPAQSNQSYITGDNSLQLQGVFRQLGVASSDAAAVAFAWATGWQTALIGVPGSASGSAVAPWFNSPNAGKLDGMLRQTGSSQGFTGALVFNQSFYRRFALGGVGTGATVAAVTGLNPAPDEVPSQPLELGLPQPGGTSITGIDAVTLEPVGQNFFYASPPTPQFGPNAASPELDKTQDIFNNLGPDKLAVFKMDRPGAYQVWRFDLPAIMRAVTNLGGNRDLFLRSLAYTSTSDEPEPLSPPLPARGIDPASVTSGDQTRSYQGSQYVFFGGGDSTPAEGSPLPLLDPAPGQQPVPASPTTQVGKLVRDRQGRWEPQGATTGDALQDELHAIAERPPVLFSSPTSPSGTPAQYAAAERALGQVLATEGIFCESGSSGCATPPGVRANYTNPDLLEDITDARLAIGCPSPNLSIPSDAYSAAQLDALAQQICLELVQLDAVHQRLFEPLQDVLADLRSDETLDLLSESNSQLGWLKDKEDEQLEDRGRFLDISGDAGLVLNDLVEGALKLAEYAFAGETGGASVAIGGATTELLGLGSDTLLLSGDALDFGGGDGTANTELTVGTLFSNVGDSYSSAAGALNELEAMLVSDPTKLAQVAGHVNQGSQDWDLTGNLPNSTKYRRADALTFQMRVAGRQYMLPRLISAAASACHTGGSSNDPSTYPAMTQFRSQAQSSDDAPTWLNYAPHTLKSVDLTSTDAQSLANLAFASPFSADLDVLAEGPQGAALSRSKFFMQQIAQTTISTSGDCAYPHLGP